MTDSTIESELTRRKGKETTPEADSNAEAESKEVVETEVEVKGAWQSVKYYFNRFRYYHFVVADTVDKYLSAVCLFFINWYFKLFMGVNAPQSVLD